MVKLNRWSLAAALLISALISWQVIGPILNDNTIVQDDFRQSMFWLWRNWDRELFRNDFLSNLYESQIYRLPLLALIYAVAPLLTDNLVYFSKLFAFVLALITCIYAYLFFFSISKDNIYSSAFTMILATTLWCTDHLTVVHARSFIWLIVFAYIYYKNNSKHVSSALICFVSLFISPIAFLLCMGMEAFFILINHPNMIFNIQDRRLQYLFANAFAALILYKVIVPESKAAGVEGFSYQPFSRSELMTLPEFLPGGRHPLFGSKLFDGTWWANEHWGLGIGFLKISTLLPIALVCILAFVVLSRRELIKIFNLNFLGSPIMLLLYSSLSLFFAAQFLFPTLYYPSRYIGISSIILSLVAIIMIVKVLLDSESAIPVKYRVSAKILVAILLVFSFYSYYHEHYFTRYVQINPKVMEFALQLPKDSLIAAHPMLPDLSLVPVTAKRKVFMDYEHAYPSLNKPVLLEIRRRNIESIHLTYVASAQEAVEVMRANGISHFMAHKIFYDSAYTNRPSYVEPYISYLVEIIAKNKGHYFFNELLEKSNTNYMIISLSEILAKYPNLK